MPNFYNTEQMNGKEYIQGLKKQQEDRYQKKFAFERGQYHQCIPNPKKENQMITVQMVTRVLNDLADRKEKDESSNDRKSLVDLDMFNDDQRNWPGEPGKYKEPDQSHYMRFNLIPPQEEADEDNVEGGDSETSSDTTSDGDKDSGSIQPVAEDKNEDNELESVKSGLSNQKSMHEENLPDREDIDLLYSEDALCENPDPLTGVSPTHYADIK